MTSSRLVRGAKTRMFAVICLFCVLGAVVYVFHGTQVRLTDVQKLVNNCNQQKETCHAELQVINEYKERLMKSVNSFKEENKKCKESEKKCRESHDKLENDLIELRKRYEAQESQLQDKSQKLKNEQSNMNTLMQSKNKEIEAKDKKIEELKKNLEDLQKILKVEETKKEDFGKQLKDCTMTKSLSESNVTIFLEHQKSTLEKELALMKEQLENCKAKETLLPSPLSEPKGNKESVIAVESEKMSNGFMRNFSSTPGINPEAVMGLLSSVKPSVKEYDLGRKQDEQVGAMPPKKPTQESAVKPIAQPGKIDDIINLGQGQIPLPPNPMSNILQRPNVNEETNDMSNNINLIEDEDPVIRQQQAKAQIQEPHIFPDANRAEEEDEQVGAAHFKQVGKNPENYHGGDYDKEQVEEEDDEGEQIEYEGDRSIKDSKGKVKMAPPLKIMHSLNSGGVMVNPK